MDARSLQSMNQPENVNERHRNAMVFVNEDLTARRVALARMAQGLKKDGNVKDSWTTNGKILIKDNNNIRNVRSGTDLTAY